MMCDPATWTYHPWLNKYLDAHVDKHRCTLSDNCNNALMRTRLQHQNLLGKSKMWTCFDRTPLNALQRFGVRVLTDGQSRIGKHSFEADLDLPFPSRRNLADRQRSLVLLQ